MWSTVFVTGCVAVALVKYWYVGVPVVVAVVVLFLAIRIRRGRKIVQAREATKAG